MKLNKKLKPNKLVIAYMSVLMLILAIVFYFSFEMTTVEHSIQRINTPIVIKGINGTDGKNGLNGVQGIAGQNAVSTHTITEKNTNTQTIIETETAIPGPTGATGVAGQNGINGKNMQIQYDPNTGQLEYKYDGDRTWTVVSNSPTTTEAQDND